jgi:hypothetical protein
VPGTHAGPVRQTAAPSCSWGTQRAADARACPPPGIPNRGLRTRHQPDAQTSSPPSSAAAAWRRVAVGTSQSEPVYRVMDSVKVWIGGLGFRRREGNERPAPATAKFTRPNSVAYRTSVSIASRLHMHMDAQADPPLNSRGRQTAAHLRVGIRCALGRRTGTVRCWRKRRRTQSAAPGQCATARRAMSAAALRRRLVALQRHVAYTTIACRRRQALVLCQTCNTLRTPLPGWTKRVQCQLAVFTTCLERCLAVAAGVATATPHRLLCVRSRWT